MSGNANQVMTIGRTRATAPDAARSPPRRVRVASASAVAGDTSVVGRVNTLTLIARFAGSASDTSSGTISVRMRGGGCVRVSDVGDGHTPRWTETNCGCDAAVAAAGVLVPVRSLPRVRRSSEVSAHRRDGVQRDGCARRSSRRVAQIERLGRYSGHGRAPRTGGLAAAVTG